jgi:hypothetical protein
MLRTIMDSIQTVLMHRPGSPLAYLPPVRMEGVNQATIFALGLDVLTYLW